MWIGFKRLNIYVWVSCVISITTNRKHVHSNTPFLSTLKRHCSWLQVNNHHILVFVWQRHLLKATHEHVWKMSGFIRNFIWDKTIIYTYIVFQRNQTQHLFVWGTILFWYDLLKQRSPYPNDNGLHISHTPCFQPLVFYWSENC